ncbi:MAG: BirA family transcriptional regulator [Actinomycetota bacterium]|nr:BirA family transcriptional regulator [Actinomycetota bacterium]
MLDTGARRALAATRFADVTWLGEVTSTNDEVAARARAGAPEGVVVVADAQSRGRGRRGRTWAASPGSSLLVSVLLRPVAPHLGLVAAGLAAVDACRAAAGVDVRLKWPNDVVLDGPGDESGAKVAGILAEGGANGVVVVGLGLNVDWGGMPLPPGGASLAEVAEVDVDRAALLVAYLVALEGRCREDPGSLMAAYRAACSTIGHHVRVELPGGASLEGRATGVADDGRLLVDGSPVAAGDVVHLR